VNLGLEGKVALVTGAGSPIGFGRAIALTLAKEGCSIVANDINVETAEQTAALIKKLGREAMAVKADISKTAEVNDMVKVALQRFGKIDILVNNAGATTPFGPFVSQNEADWDKTININLKGPMICAKAVLPNMLERKSGNIINISSGGAKRGSPFGDAYAAAKAGVIIFTKSLSNEVTRSGIRVNAIAPGPGETNLGMEHTPPEAIKRRRELIEKEVPVGRPTTPQDIANMVAFLASDVSSDIVGQTFSVDGGST
jgi:NAD(P)-dependent dehydrogenase (short-subunit alcohol dehydrogenase family)